MRRRLLTAFAFAAVVIAVLAVTRVQREREYVQLIQDGNLAFEMRNPFALRAVSPTDVPCPKNSHRNSPMIRLRR